jgi:hypothetical protein
MTWRFPFALVWGVRRRDAGVRPLGCGFLRPGIEVVNFEPLTRVRAGGTIGFSEPAKTKVKPPGVVFGNGIDAVRTIHNR